VLGIVSVCYSIDHGFANRRRWETPALLATYRADPGSVERVLLDEVDHLFDCSGKASPDLHVIKDPGSVHAFKSPNLIQASGNRPSRTSALPKSRSPSTLATLMRRRKVESPQVTTLQAANGVEALGSSSEVKGFRAQVGDRLLVIGVSAGESLHLLNQLGIGNSVCGTYPYVDTALGSVRCHAVWPT
jgi:hypothetical protein